MWKFPRERLDDLDSREDIYWPKQGKVPRRKAYYDEKESGKPIPDLMDDVNYMSKKERAGWRTQKLIVLLRRLIKASSNRGDLLLDPFCGCATACVVDEIEGRQWVGIDACAAADEITRVRLSDVSMDWEDKALRIIRTPPRKDILEKETKTKNTEHQKTLIFCMATSTEIVPAVADITE